MKVALRASAPRVNLGLRVVISGKRDPALLLGSAGRLAASCPIPCQQQRAVHSVKVAQYFKWSKQLTPVQCSLFGWLKGKQQQAGVAVETHDTVTEDKLPFPLSILNNTHLQGRQLACAYRATAHGWGALQFHKHSDMKGPCVIYCETEHGARFGGFNSEGFKSSDDYTSSSKAFLFCWTASDGALVILHKIGGSEAALSDYARGGPQWGADALIIGPTQAPVMGGMAGPESQTLGAGDLHTAKSRLGLAYEKLPKELQQTSLLGGSLVTAVLAQVEVYYAPEIAALY